MTQMITTLEQLEAQQAGFVGLEPDGTAVQRAFNGIGAVWRRADRLSGNLLARQITLPVTVLTPAAAVDPASDAITTLKALFPADAGWDVYSQEEGGQPNGNGHIETSDYRPWFTDEREDHHRTEYTITGPWLPGPRESVRERVEWLRQEAARRQAKEEEETLRKAQEILARRASALGQE